MLALGGKSVLDLKTLRSSFHRNTWHHPCGSRHGIDKTSIEKALGSFNLSETMGIGVAMLESLNVSQCEYSVLLTEKDYILAGGLYLAVACLPKAWTRPENTENLFSNINRQSPKLKFPDSATKCASARGLYSEDPALLWRRVLNFVHNPISSYSW
ncbi:hypothetical protein BD779DRAFT_483416 [Infundibulicybe gibba]|nr:hypothetical protein BD779DRAFT_483416 [Infundibulicybe gibba]